MTSYTFNGTGPLTQTTVSTDIGDASIVIITGYSSIDFSAFKSQIQISSVTIPDSVTSIGADAFYACSGLTSITIPDSVTSLGTYAFQGCSGLTSVTLGNSVNSIDQGAFLQCTILTSVTIPNSVTSIGQNAFLSSGLLNVYISSATAAILYVLVPATNITFFGKSGVTTILIVPPTITFPAITATYGDLPINPIVYTSNSNGAVTYTSSNTLVATISGSTITFVGLGTSTITASQEPTTMYASATTTATCTVDAATPTITFPDINAIYGDPPITIVYTSNSDGAVTYTSSDTSVATISGSTITFVGIVTSTITASQAATVNYASATTTSTCTVGGNTPRNPVIITTGADLMGAMVGPSRFIQINGDITIPGGLVGINNKTITVANGGINITTSG
jgi:hypothetical protein